MFEKFVEDEPETLEFIPDHFKTQEMCERAVEDDPYSLQYVPDWFVTQQQIDVWYDDNEYHDDDDDDDDDEVIEWYDGYQKRKTQKAKIKDELMPIAWHPSKWWDWCVSEDKKKETENFFLTI